MTFLQLLRFVVLTWVCFSQVTRAEEPQTFKWVFIGDSLTEGLGVNAEQAYPAVLQKKFKNSNHPFLKKIQVVNSGQSGSTSASAPGRVRWVLKAKPQGVLLALGANDGLRGLKTSETKKNLGQAIEIAKKANVDVILVSMQMPTNYGKDYRKSFEEVFDQLAKEFQLPKPVFLLKDVGAVPELNQADGIHPNPMGHEKMAQTVYSIFESHYGRHR